MTDLPVLPTSFPLQQITAEALDRQYAGLPTEAEAKRLTKKYFSIPKELEALADLLVQDSRVLYRSFEDLARHALYELLNADLVTKTRQGGLGRCSLYAVKWLKINPCDGKLEVQPTTTPPRHTWDQKALSGKRPWKPKKSRKK